MNECCEHEDNLHFAERLEMDIIVRVCRVCHRRHFEMLADVGEIYSKDEVDNG